MKAIWNKQIIAESEDVIELEDNYYFLESDVNLKYLKSSSTYSTCALKGKASFFSLEVNGQIKKDAARLYLYPSPSVKQIKNRIAFWKGVEFFS